ncbi:MAG: alpha/beta fold hydrolase [Janthinobacterium lividum]
MSVDPDGDGSFRAGDGTVLAYRRVGSGPVLVCLPGGPLQDGAYLGDLGGLSAHRQLIVAGLRGSGRYALPLDPACCRCDRLVDDVERLRRHLDLDRFDVLAHSAGTNLALLYAQHHPERLAKLALIAPSPAAVGLTVSSEDRRAVAQLRRGEPWFAAAATALEAVLAGEVTPEVEQAIAPFRYGRWDETARAQHAAWGQRDDAAALAFAAPGAFDPARTRAALARSSASVLVLAGEVDVNSPPRMVSELAGLSAPPGSASNPEPVTCRGWTTPRSSFVS